MSYWVLQITSFINLKILVNHFRSIKHWTVNEITGQAQFGHIITCQAIDQTLLLLEFGVHTCVIMIGM